MLNIKILFRHNLSLILEILIFEFNYVNGGTYCTVLTRSYILYVFFFFLSLINITRPFFMIRTVSLKFSFLVVNTQYYYLII